MKRTPELHDYVVASIDPEAGIFKVVEVDGRVVGLVDAEIKILYPERAQQTQWVDVSLLQKPSAFQVRQLEKLHDE
jgi:hypothetical protein